MSNWAEALKTIPPVPECPHCHDERSVEKIGAVFFCRTCSKEWKAEQ